MAQVAGFSMIRLDISDFPTRHPYGLGLRQKHVERILAGWVGELAVTLYRDSEVTGFVQDDTHVDVELADGGSLRAEYLVGCDGGRSLVRKTLGIGFDSSLRELADDSPALRPLADTLRTSTRLGTPVAPALARLATEVRADVRRRAEARARTIPVRLCFPLVGCVLPAFALLTVVPVVVDGLHG